MNSAYSITATESTLALPRWQLATWGDYFHHCDRAAPERARIFFNQGYLFIEMGTD